MQPNNLTTSSRQLPDITFITRSNLQIQISVLLPTNHPWDSDWIYILYIYCIIISPLLLAGKPWWIGNSVRMVDNKIARELLDKIDVFEHTRVTRHIPRSADISLKYFENSRVLCEYFLDLDEVFIKNKCKVLKFRTPDPDHVYDIFGKYSHEEASVVRTSVIDYITCDLISFNEWMVVVFTMLHLNLDEWLLRTKNPNLPVDEAAVYGLCQLYSRHALCIHDRQCVEHPRDPWKMQSSRKSNDTVMCTLCFWREEC